MESTSPQQSIAALEIKYRQLHESAETMIAKLERENRNALQRVAELKQQLGDQTEEMRLMRLTCDSGAEQVKELEKKVSEANESFTAILLSLDRLRKLAG